MSRYQEKTIPHHLVKTMAKGRGAVSNDVGRYERYQRECFDDGWENPPLPKADDDPFQDSPQIATTLTVDASKKIINYVTSPDIPFDRSINPYRGCEHGCVYCFARPTHTYWGLSAGLDFETKLFYKPNAVELLEKELAHPKYSPAPIAFGTNTDPYQPVEAEKKITRALLTKLTECRHPFTIVTKNNMVLRDLDILEEAAQHNLVRVMLSVTTLDHKLANKLEPRATTPKKRLEAIRELNKAGVPVSSLVAPIIPGLNDHEIEAIFEALADHGAETAGYLLVRLPLEIKQLFAEWLDEHFPDRKDRVLSLIKQCRDGKLNQSEFGKRFIGSGPVADIISKRANKARKKYFTTALTPEHSDLTHESGKSKETQIRAHYQRRLSCDHFTPPTPKGGQFNLL